MSTEIVRFIVQKDIINRGSLQWSYQKIFKTILIVKTILNDNDCIENKGHPSQDQIIYHLVHS